MRPFSTLLTAILLLAAATNSQAQAIDHWETVVNYDVTWRYFPTASEPDPNWRQLGYNDAAWASGPGGVGFGDGDDNTTVPLRPSIYIRHVFNIIDTATIAMAMMSMDYDDGFIAYINNVEIARSNLGAAVGDLPPYNQYANGQHEAQMYQGGTPESFVIDKALLSTCLVPGNNVLAITVHNATVNSSDMSSLTWLHLGLTTNAAPYGPNPGWFVPPMTSSNIPIAIIDTRGQLIVDDVRIVAHLGIIDNGPGLRNNVTDSFNDYDGEISIEIRGSTSQQYPKVSYGVETQDTLGNNLDVSLLGMPSENDWVFYAPYPDKTCIRNTLTYHLFDKMRHYSPQTRYCELIINGEYRGIYEIMDKIKIDDHRLDLPKLDSPAVAGIPMTGGYIIKIDKTTGQGNPAWTSPFSPDVFFQLHDPKDTEIDPAQSTYIEDFVTDFETALNGPNFADPALGYRAYIDVQSFMDFMIMQEIGRTVDGYRSSSFFHKQRDDLGGKLSAGPMWDFNLSYGNADYCDAYAIQGYQYQFNNICGGYSPEVPFWWTKLMTDARWRTELRCRWDDLRGGVLSTTYIHNLIDSAATLLDEAKERNFAKWPILGQYVNWNYFVGNTYQEEIDYFKDWINQRLTWLDANLPTPPPACNTVGAENIVVTEINYNSDTLANSGDWIELYNTGNSAVNLSDWKFKDANPDNLFTFPTGTTIPAGGYLVLCEDVTQFHTRHPLVNNVVGPFTFKFDNGGERLYLYDAYYSEVLKVKYNDQAPWPLTPDGDGFTLEVVDPAGNPDDGTNWFAGCPEGSPGGPFVAPCIVNVTEPFAEAGFYVSPNPFQQGFSISFENADWTSGNGLEISLYDLNGKRLHSTIVQNVSAYYLNVNDLPAGVYVLRVGNLGVQRVIKF